MQLLIDGMMSGTGIRDRINGGYIDPEALGLSSPLVDDLRIWLSRYEDAHYAGFDDAEVVSMLDRQGVALAERMTKERTSDKVRYYSNAHLKELE